LRPRERAVSAVGGLPVSDWPLVPPTPVVSGGQSVPSPGPQFLELLCVTVQREGCRSVLAGVVALAERAPGLSDEQLRAALVALGRSSRRLVGETR
jgi:hypothetical protein